MNLVLESVAPHVTAIRLNRPDRLNAISFDLVGDLHDALDQVAADDDCKVAILTGNGRAFCAGLDLKDWGAIHAPGTRRHFPAGQTGQSYLANLMQHIRATPQIVLAAVNGPAFGGGLTLSLACDLRIAGESARFCSAFIKTGLTGTDAGVSYLLPRLIGAARAFDMIVTGRTVEASEAERLGIVSRVVPDAQLWDEALSIATTVAGYTTFGLRNTKEVMWHNLDTNNMAAAIALENRNQDLANKSDEVREYMRNPGNLLLEEIRKVVTGVSACEELFVRAQAAELGVEPSFFEKAIHVHVPAGATPKDGPSAGITMVTALTSLATGRPVRSDVGMTGEVTLNGRVLPIGGVKQKLLAAQRAGLKTVFIPARNEPDLDDVPAEVLDALEVKPMTDVADIIVAALEPAAEQATAAA